MAFTPGTLDKLAVAIDGLDWWDYRTTDTIATVEAAGYFNSYAPYFNKNDKILISASDNLVWYFISALTANKVDYKGVGIGGASNSVTITRLIMPVSMLANGPGLSVIGVTASVSGPEASIVGGASQVLRVNSGATALAFTTTNIKKQTFTASGVYTPTAGMTFCVVECIGCGGGGGGCAVTNANIGAGGGGGGAGSYSRSYLSAATVGASQTITIGTAGPGGVAGANPGTAGGDVSFGVLVIGKGGQGGAGGAAGGGYISGGAGGVAGTGDITGVGEQGTISVGNTGSGVASGFGGNTLLGGGGASGAQSAGGNGTGFGAGGGGGNGFNGSAATAGGNGTAGIVIVTEYINI